jgi:hypothetical protein
MDMEITAAHEVSLGPTPDSSFRNPVAIGGRVAIFHQPVG